MASSIIEPIVFPNELRKTGYQKNYLKLVFTKHKVSNKNANLEITEIQHPVMFLPIAPRLLVESVSANYNTENIGVLGNVLFSNIREYGMTPEGVQGAMAHTIDNFKATEALEAFVTSGILRADNAAIKAGTYAEGVAYNPNTTTFFQGQNQAYRLFYFTWNLFAKNEIEAKNLITIENTFRKNVLPTTINRNIAATINYNNHYKYPSNLHLEIYVNDEIYNKFKFLPTVVTKLDISHNDVQDQNEMAFFEGEDGVAKYYTSTSISLTLQETKVFTRSDVDSVHQ